MPDIRLTDLIKRYAAGAEPAVRGVSLTIEDGDFMCILGPSGCGKTTILRMIAGLEPISDGEIAIGPRIVDSTATGRFVPPEKRDLGLVFQSYALWPHMTVARNIEFGLRLRRLDRAARRTAVGEVMAKLRIEGLGDRWPGQLSGGQQQRVALARALVVNPGVLLLDEPLSNLDAALRLKMREELARLHRAFGTTIIFVTHDQWEAMTLATRIAVMRGGKLQQIGRPDAIYHHPANRFVAGFIGNPPINMVGTGTPLAAALERSGALGGQRAALGRAAAIGLRPEGLTLHRERGPASVPLSLRSILPTGGSWIIELEHCVAAEPSRLRGVTHVPPCWQVGETLHLQPHPEALHLFDAHGTRIAPDSGSLSTASGAAVPFTPTTALN